MDKRIEKRHKREVARARNRVKLSEPDVRTPEQIKAAREASRPDTNRGDIHSASGSARPFRSSPGTATGSAAKTDG
jgi:hypothetical protein